VDEIVEFSAGDLKFKSNYRSGQKIIVFSHGFGVDRFSRGMFSDIADSMPDEWGYMLFDYNKIEGSDVYLRSYSEQVAMLNSVIGFAASLTKEVYLIGHSMGSVTASLAYNETPKKVVFLAPPLRHGGSARQKWAAYNGARYENGILVVPRRDGTTSHIPDAFFDEAHEVHAMEAMADYSKIREFTIIQALEEEIIPNTADYDKLVSDRINLVKIHGNHNFDPPHRSNLIHTIIDILTV